MSEWIQLWVERQAMDPSASTALAALQLLLGRDAPVKVGRPDLWALSPRNTGVAAVREKSDERWREAIRSIVLAGQEAGEFSPVDADDFTITLSALLDGFAVQIALDDPAVPPQRTYDLAMRFAAGQLGFDLKPAPAGRRTRTRAS